MLNLNSVMIGSEEPGKLADFYTTIIEKEPDMEEGGWFGWSIGSAFLTIGPHSEIKGKAQEPQRVMFNFETSEVQTEFERIKALGVKVIAEPYSIEAGEKPGIATFADPDGNYFQLMAPWEKEA